MDFEEARTLAIAYLSIAARKTAYPRKWAAIEEIIKQLKAL